MIENSFTIHILGINEKEIQLKIIFTTLVSERQTKFKIHLSSMVTVRI